MPHSNRTKPSQNGFVPATFVNPVFTDDERAKIKATVWDMEALESALARLCDGGYKITIRFDVRNDCFACWIAAPDSGPNKGYILAGRGSTGVKAIKQAVYAHFVQYEGDWTQGGDRPTAAIDD